MKAVILKEVGGPENLVLAEVPMPVLKNGEVLVSVKAIAINPVDAFVRRNQPALDLVYARTGNEQNIILGWDIAGVVTQVAEGVSKLNVGDEVFGNINFIGQGNAYAEYVAAPEKDLVIKPSGIGFENAAGATMAALTAWVSLVKEGQVKKGEKVVIHGASGGVGHYAVQLAKHFGAHVIGVSSGANRAFVLGIGADEFIDYKSQRFEEVVNDADIVHDAVWEDEQMFSDSPSHLSRSLAALKPGGRLLSLVIHPTQEFIDQAMAEKQVTVRRVNVAPNETYQADLGYIAGLLQSGEVVTHVSQVFPLEQTYKAHELIQSKNTVGKIIVTP
jgi:NADPH:quinone reductase-like Zn-dependent oxidoreductase